MAFGKIGSHQAQQNARFQALTGGRTSNVANTTHGSKPSPTSNTGSNQSNKPPAKRP